MRYLFVITAMLAVTGCSASDMSVFADGATDTDVVRIATYNIHHWVGADERADVARIARVIDELDVDVVALQEVDNNLVGEGDLRRQQLFAEMLDGEWVSFAPGEEPTWTAHGNAVFVRPHVEVVRAQSFDVSEPDRDPRAFTETILDVRGQRVRLIGAHLGLNGRERDRQIQAVAAQLSQSADVDGTVVVGDFNEWNPLARTFRPIRALLRDIGTARSFPAGGPLFRLDRIFTSEHAIVDHVEVMRTAVSVEASDHLPVRAALVF